jgi:hypothetical protein
LDLTSAGLNSTTTKDIADGLMRAKQLEILKIGKNPSMSVSVNSIIYNLAFSPKIRFINLEGMSSANPDTAEALYKLLNISGSIETLILRNSDVIPKLTEEFWKSVGQNKTLHTLDLCCHINPPAPNLVAKACAMNAKKNGNLKVLYLFNWFTTYSKLNSFCEATKITEQDHEFWYGDRNVASKMVKEEAHNKVMHFNLDYLNIGGPKTNLANIPFKPKIIEAAMKQEWPAFFQLVTKSKGLILAIDDAKFNPKDMEFWAYALGKNPMGECKVDRLNIRKSPFGKEGAKLLAPALTLNKSLVQIDLSSCKLGVSGMYQFADALKTNNTIKTINLYRNILDVDGARSIGAMLKVNKTLEFIDIGHNRVRDHGLQSICDGILSNPDSKLTKLGIKSNFLSDDAINMLFEKLVLPVYSGRKQQLTHIYMKKNFVSEYNKVALANKVAEKKVNVFVDDFRCVDLLNKEKLEKSIWISPMPTSETIASIKEQLITNEVGYVVDVRLSTGGEAPGRTQKNTFATVEFADPNSINRSLQLASKGRAFFGGAKVRIYRSGTQTAVIQPRQARRK